MQRGQKLSALIVLGIVLVAVAGWLYYRDLQLSRGQQAFQRYGCGDCHNNGGGPNLANVTEKYDRATLTRFINDPDSIYRERSNRSLNPGRPHMPRVGVKDGDAELLAAYLRSLD
jgi:mono/diheme cytochrome c family protein